MENNYMRRNFSKKIVAFYFSIILCIPVFAQEKSPKNIILIIGDGMGHSCIQAANYYTTGKEKAQAYEYFPVMTWQTTYNAKNPISGTSEDEKAIYYNLDYRSDKTWTDFNWVKRAKTTTNCDGFTDSAAAATALSTGKKTFGGGVNIDVDGNKLLTITEHAINIGKKAGIVTSVQISHATPAGFIAHNRSRSNYSEIAKEMLLESKLSVLMGTGHPDYDKNAKYSTGVNGYDHVGNSNIWNDLMAGKTTLDDAYPKDIDGDGHPDSWSLIQDLTDFVQIADGTKAAPKRLLGVPRAGATLQAQRDGKWNVVHDTPYLEGIPTLAQMSKAAFNALKNDEGFFLMIEGGAIDWANTSNTPGRMIEEMMDLNNTVDEAIKWIEANGGWDENLLIVTTDHECGYVLGPNTKNGTVNNPVDNPIINKGKGNMPGLSYNSKSHTNMLCPVYAKGAGAELLKTHESRIDFYRGRHIDNTDIATTMFTLWDNKEPQIKNYIIMLANGSGFNQVLATNYYTTGKANAQAYESFPVVSPMTTYAGRNGNMSTSDAINLYWPSYNSWRAWSEFAYFTWNCTTSGPAATAMSTGVKTFKNAINVDLNKNSLLTVPEIAAKKGKSTGIVTTNSFSEATAAGFGGAHNVDKFKYADIAQELFYNTNLSVIIGTGHPGYDNRSKPLDKLKFSYIDQPTWDALTDGRIDSNGQTLKDIDGDSYPDPWTLIHEPADFVEIAAGENVPLRLAGIPKVHETLQAYRINGTIGQTGGLLSSKKYNPNEYAKNTEVPELSDMSLAALNVLNKNQNGFYLMIEGGGIDLAGKANQMGIMIEEHEDFNKAVEKVMEWVELNSNWDETLLIVTSCHESGYLIGPNHRNKSDNRPTSNPITNKGKGVIPGHSFHSNYSIDAQGHSNQLVPLYAKGVGAQKLASRMSRYDYLRGYFLDNTNIPQIVFESWNKLPDADPGFPVGVSPYESTVFVGNILNVYPTLVDDEMTVESRKNELISIFDLKGTLVFKQKANATKTTLNVGFLQKGLYIVQAGNKHAKIVKK